MCSYRMNKDGEIEELTDDGIDAIHRAMDVMTRSGLRCLGVCYRIYDIEDIQWKSRTAKTLEDSAAEPLFTDMVWVACTGIADPVRPEVPDAVATCQRAGAFIEIDGN